MDRQFYKTALRMLVPMILQNVFAAMMGSVDVVMLNMVGQRAIASVSLATQYSSILFMVQNGIGSGAIVLAAQYWGKSDIKALEVIEGIALKLSLAVALLFAFCAAVFPSALMRLFTSDTLLAAEGSKYLRVIWVFYLLSSVFSSYFAMLRSTGRIAISTTLSGVSFLLNIAFNAAFISGLFGSYWSGVRGVAAATCISSAICVAGCFVVSAKSPDIKLKLSFMFRKSAMLFRDFVHLSLPAVLNDLSWGVAFSVYVAIMGRLGSDVVAANSLVVVVRSFATVFCFAVAGVGGIMVGNLIGSGRLDEAQKGAVAFLKVTVLTALVGSLLIFAATPFVLRFASLSPTALGYLKVMLYINTYYIMGAAVNTTLIAGIFRAGGKTRFGLICDTIDMWGYGVISGLLTAFVFKLPVLWVYFFMCLDEFVKWPWVFSYYKSKKWLQNITRDNLALA